MMKSGPTAAAMMITSDGAIRNQRFRMFLRSAAAATSRALGRWLVRSALSAISYALAMISVPHHLRGIVVDDDAGLVALRELVGIGAAVLLADDELVAVLQPHMEMSVGAEIDHVLQ